MHPSREHQHLPELVRTYLARSLRGDGALPAAVRVKQAGEMRRKPGARPLRFTATEHFAVDRVGFAWRASFPLVGPLAMTVVDQLAEGKGQLRVSLLGLPLQTQTGPETTVGEAMRYLAELVWAPPAITANRALGWRELDERALEVTASVPARVAVRWRFDDNGDLLEATGELPFPVGKSFVSRLWGGRFGEYASFGGVRAPTNGEAWWQLPEGRFVYWRARVTALDLLEPAKDLTDRRSG
jgi:hypothetical protein